MIQIHQYCQYQVPLTFNQMNAWTPWRRGTEVLITPIPGHLTILGVPNTLQCSTEGVNRYHAVYSFWTRIISTMLSTYCEQYGHLSEPQEGFRKQKNCQRQLQYLKLVLEDAKMHKRDLCISRLDIKKAFDTVDHPRLFQILQALGIP